MSGKSNTTFYLTQGLIVSGALNICLLAFLFFFLVQEKPLISWSRIRPLSYSTVTEEVEESAAAVVLSLMEQPFDILVDKLEETELVEDGYSIRDLSLGIMVSKHSFDIERALQGLPRPYEDRLLQINPEVALLVYPGLTDIQFRAISEFASKEWWPFTAKGLFSLLKSEGLEDSLVASFSLTKEFTALDKLFYDVEVKPQTLIEIFLESDWETFSHTLKKPNLTRQTLLMDYVSLQSKKAASTLIETDFQYATKRLDDQSVMLLLNLTDNEEYMKQILLSPRSQATIFMAAEKLYTLSNEKLPDPFDYKKALAKFCPKEPKKEVVPDIKSHTVGAGDSLWKISRQYTVSIDAIKSHNKLESDVLRPGMILLIP